MSSTYMVFVTNPQTEKREYNTYWVVNTATMETQSSWNEYSDAVKAANDLNRSVNNEKD